MTQERSNKFWSLSSPDSLAGRVEWVDGEVELESIRCPLDSGHQRAGKRLSNLSVLLTPKRIPDFVWTWYSDCLIQDRVLQLFRNEGLTGFEVKPVKARMKVRARHRDPCDEDPGLKAEDAAKIEIPTLWELVITGSGGTAPPECGFRITRNCPACGSLKYTLPSDPSLLIDIKQWDGADFFTVWPYGFRFITDRVAKLIRREKLNGVKVLSAESDVRETAQYFAERPDIA